MGQKIIKGNNRTINFGDNTWSSNEKMNSYPWALVGVEGEVIFNGEKGGIDLYDNFNKDGYNYNDDSCFAITVGDMKDHKEDGTRDYKKDGNGNTDYLNSGISGNLTIKGGVYKAVGCQCIYVCKGTCTIEGGIFFAQPSSGGTKSQSDAEREKYGEYRNFLLNCWDTNYKNGTAKIIVTGGTFVGFDPADNYAEDNNGISFVPTGYKSIEDGEWTYMVKDTNDPDNGKLRTLKCYKVVEDK